MTGAGLERARVHLGLPDLRAVDECLLRLLADGFIFLDEFSDAYSITDAGVARLTVGGAASPRKKARRMVKKVRH
jgi:hypothetical protein